jgi:hypothetical protein
MISLLILFTCLLVLVIVAREAYWSEEPTDMGANVLAREIDIARIRCDILEQKWVALDELAQATHQRLAALHNEQSAGDGKILNDLREHTIFSSKQYLELSVRLDNQEHLLAVLENEAVRKRKPAKKKRVRNAIR